MQWNGQKKQLENFFSETKTVTFYKFVHGWEQLECVFF